MLVFTFAVALCFSSDLQILAITTKAAQLERVLDGWELANSKLKSLEVSFTQTNTDKVFQSRTKSEGTWRYSKAANSKQKDMIGLEMVGENKERTFSIGPEHFYFYDSSKKTVLSLQEARTGWLRIWTFPNERLSHFLTGAAKNLTDRYRVTFASEDKHYFYLQVNPKSTKDNLEFSIGELAIRKTSFLPCHLWLLQPNGNEVRWDFEKIAPNLPLEANDFAAPAPPRGWRLERINFLAQPDAATRTNPMDDSPSPQ